MSGPKHHPNPIELGCQELVELVTEYLGSALDATDRVRFEKHLVTCPPCTAYLAQVQATRALASELSRAEPLRPTDGDVERELTGMFRRWHGK